MCLWWGFSLSVVRATMFPDGAQKREAILLRIASDLEAHEPAILDANAVDVAAAERRHIDATLLQRLRLKPAKLRTLAAGIRAIAAQEEPLRKVRLLSCCPAARINISVVQLQHVSHSGMPFAVCS